MATSLFSPSWYRVKDLKPRLRRHVAVHRHDYRGRVWFVIQDIATGRFHRISPAAWRLVGLMNGKRTMDELWNTTNEQLGEKAPTQDEAIRLMGQLHAADALICDVPPDGRELFRRYQRHQSMQIKQKIWSPLAVRIPIWDPDAFLTRTMPFVRPFFTRTFAVIWVLVVLAGFIFAAINFGAITDNIADRVLTPKNLFVLWLVYPVVKAFHELGHGYAVKKNGGEVHEIGIMLLVLVPVPYVDASAASALRDKYQRMLVGGIGIMVELFLASIALFVWLNAETGAAHAVAYNVMLIGGVSTLLFNGNPLLRFDGYYVFADWLEIPNLGQRANRYYAYLAQKYLFGMKDAEPVTSLPAEKRWFLFYGIAAFIYRLFIMFAIITYIAGRFFFIGVLLAAWAITTQILVPIGKSMSFLSSSPKLRSNRPRAILVTSGLIAALFVILFVLPAPYRSVVSGVTWPSEQAQVRVGTSGFVTEVPVATYDAVKPGEVMIKLDDPLLRARLEVLDSQLAGLELQRQAAVRTDRVEAEMIAAEISATREDRNRLAQQLDELSIRAPRAGLAVVPNGEDLQGRFAKRGQVISYVLTEEDTAALRVVVGQDDVDLVRNATGRVDVMPVEYGGQSYPATIVREVPGGIRDLPTPALGLQGGGTVPVDPGDTKGLRTLQRVFEFELEMAPDAALPLLGRRVEVRFSHGSLPIGFQAYRALRQLFLRLYDV